MATSISALIRPCLQIYRDLFVNIHEFASAHGAEAFSVPWEDELGRLQVWTANIGAHQTGQSSLDFRLRDASHIRQQIVRLLQDLAHTLQDVRSLTVGNNSLASTSDNRDSTALDEPLAELSELHEELVGIIDCLCQMSILVRRPARHSFLTDLNFEDKAYFGPHDIRHVSEKFPKADRSLVNNLGAAITRRRKHLDYYKRHRAKLGKGMEILGGQQTEGTTSELSETIATDFQVPTFRDEATMSDSGTSQTSYATSLTAGNGMTIPAPPAESHNGSPFECPYCFYLITIISSEDWQKHVFKDILPYICVFPDCSIQDRLFDSRREWFQHLKSAHRSNLQPQLLDDSVPQSESQVTTSVTSSHCPLCRESLQSATLFQRHVARHLQELALFALPGQDLNDPLNESPDPSQVSIASSESLEVRSVSTGWKTTFEMAFHLPNDRSITTVAKLDSGFVVDVLSQSLADSLGLTLEAYYGNVIEPLGNTITPLGQLTLDWHVMGRSKQCTTTFLVLDNNWTKGFDVLLSDDTIAKKAFYKVNKQVW